MNKLHLVTKAKDMFEGNKDYSFVNPYSLAMLIKTGRDYSSIRFGVDGGLLAKVLSVLLGVKINRISFDYTSIAKEVFEKAQRMGLRVALIGSEQGELDLFIAKIREEYPRLNIFYAHSGYFNESDLLGMTQEVVKGDLLICSMGAVRQEDFILSMRRCGFKGVSYTCGGFFRQYASAENAIYYPGWVNDLNLRAFYRMFKEPHTIKRYFFSYPISILNLILLRLIRKLHVVVN